jgi:hypothetical protein
MQLFCYRIWPAYYTYFPRVFCGFSRLSCDVLWKIRIPVKTHNTSVLYVRTTLEFIAQTLAGNRSKVPLPIVWIKESHTIRLKWKRKQAQQWRIHDIIVRRYGQNLFGLQNDKTLSEPWPITPREICFCPMHAGTPTCRKEVAIRDRIREIKESREECSGSERTISRVKYLEVRERDPLPCPWLGWDLEAMTLIDDFSFGNLATWACESEFTTLMQWGAIISIADRSRPSTIITGVMCEAEHCSGLIS